MALLGKHFWTSSKLNQSRIQVDVHVRPPKSPARESQLTLQLKFSGLLDWAQVSHRCTVVMVWFYRSCLHSPGDVYNL